MKPQIGNTMKVFDMRCVDFLIKSGICPCAAGYNDKEAYVLFKGTDAFWLLFKSFK